MAATPSLLVKYTVPSLGGTRTVTNRFHFSGGLPADNAHWVTFSDAVVAKMHFCLSDACEIVEAVGYDAAADVAVFDKVYTTAGTHTHGAAQPGLPGFCCAIARWATSARTSKNHPIYLFSYIHGILSNGEAEADAQKVATGMLTDIEDFAATWWNAGFTDGVNVYRRAGPNGTTALSSSVDQYVRDHDLSPR